MSLFVTWSHQFPTWVLAIPGMRAALAGVPRDADAWQVYSVADALLAALAAVLMGTAVVGVPRARMALGTAMAGALAFTLHAAIVPPTSGADLLLPGRGRLLRSLATSGAGETVASAAMALALVGLLLTRAVGRGGGPGLSSNHADHAR